MTRFLWRAAIVASVVATAACGAAHDEGPAPVHPVAPSSAIPSPDETAATITILGAPNIQAGTSAPLAAEVRNAAGAIIAADVVGWSSSDPTIISVSATGVATAVRIGNVTITATVNGKRGDLAVTSSLAPFTFNFANGTTPADQQLIQDAVLLGNTFIRQAFDGGISAPVTISSATSDGGCDARSGNAAFTGAGTIVFCIANQGWLAFGPVMRQKIVVHELFHAWQFGTRWLGAPTAAGPAWIVEGAAELVAFASINPSGMLSFATARGCAVKEVADFFQRQPPGLPPLDRIEPIDVFQNTAGPLYPYSMLAMDQLTGSRGIAALKTYGNAVATGTSWQTAFQTSFGTTPAAFYAQFPAYRTSLPVPPTYPCGGM